MDSFEPYGKDSWSKTGLRDSFEGMKMGKRLGKPLARNKLLQPLPQSATRTISDTPLGFHRGLDLPPPLPGISAVEKLQADQAINPPVSRDSRPLSAQQPRIGTWVAPPLANVQFSAGMSFRKPGESMATPSLWSKPKELFVLPIQMQTAIRELAAECSSERREICDGMRLTVWVMNPDNGETSSPLVEPLAARCPDQTLALEPLDLTIERGSGPSLNLPSLSPLRFGESFRLRDASSAFYLSHSRDDCNSLRWIRLESGEDAADHHNLRFVAHGSELGAPLLFGRPLVVQRVPLPAPSGDDTDSDSSDYDSSESDSERMLRGVGPRRATKQRDPHVTTSTNAQAASSLIVDCGALLSRLTDGGTTFSAAFLPVEHNECNVTISSTQDEAIRSSSGSESEEVRGIDLILSELKTQLQQESTIEEEQRVALERTAHRRAELARQIDEGDKLRQHAKEARATRKAQNGNGGYMCQM